MSLETLKLDNRSFEIKNVIKWTRKELRTLNKEVLKNDIEENPEIIKLKNYEIKNYWTYFRIDINDLYWLTIKNVEWEIVFDAKHEWFISKEYFDLADDEIIDNWNIDIINSYLKCHDSQIITDEDDIKIIQWLFEELK